MSKPTKEEMLYNLDLIEGWVYNLLEESTFSKAEQRRITKKVLAWGKPIRALIEHGPTVSRGFVVNSARAMGVEPDALHLCLEEAGVTVKEGE